MDKNSYLGIINLGTRPNDVPKQLFFLVSIGEHTADYEGTSGGLTFMTGVPWRQVWDPISPFCGLRCPRRTAVPLTVQPSQVPRPPSLLQRSNASICDWEEFLPGGDSCLGDWQGGGNAGAPQVRFPMGIRSLYDYKMHSLVDKHKFPKDKIISE